MGTGMSDRSVLCSNLGATYGTLIFFSTSIGGAAKDEDTRLSGDEKALLFGANEGLSLAVDRLEKLQRTLDGDDLESFVDGLGEVTRCVLDELGRSFGE